MESAYRPASAMEVDMDGSIAAFTTTDETTTDEIKRNTSTPSLVNAIITSESQSMMRCPACGARFADQPIFVPANPKANISRLTPRQSHPNVVYLSDTARR